MAIGPSRCFIGGGERTYVGMNKGLFIQQASPHDEPVISLMHALAEEEAVLYADLGPDTFDSFKPDDVLNGRGTLVIASLDGQLVGCGALRQMDKESAEVNRLYVVPAARRQGIARAILGELQRRAAEFQYRKIRAETGNRQPDAILLYETSGFQRIQPFGSHADDPVSVFLEKTLF